ncbi:uncharacterized protein LOC133927255 [Phragmites australis]|uniref:uncharacterized protein LOC133927255 n=1 Tax=Phragmites australis TaxID=29695 RepID=UPI002D778AFD|nr:uncharacterized protein LOC133927255 [Phragmites australis]XP_062229615.1 uncharacterized protein LOC133927255 [Phragmites australis]
MEEDPLIPLVHMWNNAAFDHASSSAWHAHAAAAAAANVREGDEENHRPEPDAEDVDAEIDHIEAEILRLSSRLHHLRTSKQPEPKRGGEVAPAAKMVRPRPRGLSLGPLDVIAAAVNPNPLPEKQQPPRAALALKPIKQAPAPRGRGLSLGPLDIVAARPRVPAAAPQRKLQGDSTVRQILKPIMEPPVQRRRGVSLGPLEIHHGVGSRPAVAGARVNPFPNKLNAVREEGQHSKHAVPAKPWLSSSVKQPPDVKQGAAASRAKARSGNMSPRSRRQSTAKATDTRGGNAKTTETRGGNAAVGTNKVVAELKPKGVTNHTGNAGKRPAGSSKVRVVPSRYSLTSGSSLGAGTQDKRRKQSLPGSTGGASQREEIRAKVTEPSNGVLSPETIAKVSELLPRIRTLPASDESPRDSGCAKRVADLVGKRSFFTAAADDGNMVTPYQARVLDVESPEAAEA